MATILDGVENVRNLGLADGKPAVLVILYRQPGANVIETVQLYAERGWEPVDFFADVDQELRFMMYLATNSPKSYAKLRYFRDVVLPEIAAEYENDPNPISATTKRCRALPDDERVGKWTAPTAKQLAAFLPPKE